MLLLPPSPVITTPAAGATLSAKLLPTLAPALSDAVILRLTLPTALWGGVPLKLCVAALKLSQPGNAVPSAKAAE